MCESRCHRRGIACRQSIRTRKRKARAEPDSPSSSASPSASASAPASGTASASVPIETLSSTRLEAKLDDLVSLLRSQAVEKQTLVQAHALQTATPVISTSTGPYTPSATSITAAYNQSIISAPPRDPDVLVDMTASAVRLVRPSSPPPPSSPILQDVLALEVTERVVQEQLYYFRVAFLPMFPFVYLPPSVSASQLRHQKPFLWLVMLSLTNKSVSEQFALEEMIWDIISRRIVSEHLVDLDLLLGVVCFASWSVASAMM